MFHVVRPVKLEFARLQEPCANGAKCSLGACSHKNIYANGRIRQRRDSYDNLNEEGLTNCYKALIRLRELVDQGVLNDTD